MLAGQASVQAVRNRSRRKALLFIDQAMGGVSRCQDLVSFTCASQLRRNTFVARHKFLLLFRAIFRMLHAIGGESGRVADVLDLYGNHVITASRTAVDHYDRALVLMRRYERDPLAALDAALAEDPYSQWRGQFGRNCCCSRPIARWSRKRDDRSRGAGPVRATRPRARTLMLGGWSDNFCTERVCRHRSRQSE